MPSRAPRSETAKAGERSAGTRSDGTRRVPTTLIAVSVPGLPCPRECGIVPAAMDTPEPAKPAPPRPSRRTLLRLAGAGVVLGVGAEAARVLLGSNEHTVIPGRVYRSAQLGRRSSNGSSPRSTSAR